MSLESILTFTDVLYIAHLWRLEFWWSFSKVTEASEFLTIHQVLHSLLPQLFASPFFSATWSLLLPPCCASVLRSPNYIKSEIEWHWPGNTQPDFCCLNTAPELFGACLEKQGHYNTLVRMGASSHMHATFCWLLCWDFGYTLRIPLNSGKKSMTD